MKTLTNCTRPFLVFAQACLLAGLVRADYTYVWSGDDPRFSGQFSISDDDFAYRTFTNLTAHYFGFQDPVNPQASVSLSDPRNLHQDNTIGTLTSDGTRLAQTPHPVNPNVAFWVASWEFPRISVGLYSYSLRDSVEHFTYANYDLGVFADSIGAWSLIPEPATLPLLGITLSVLAIALKRNRTKSLELDGRVFHVSPPQPHRRSCCGVRPSRF